MIDRIVMNPKLLRRIAIGMIVTTFLFSGAASSFGADGDGDSTTEQHIALQVYYDDELLKGFTMDELEQIAISEGSDGVPKQYDYSGYSSHPTYRPLRNVIGPTVEGILNESLSKKGKSVDELNDDQLMKFSQNGDSKKEFFLKRQLLAQRYYYPSYETTDGGVKVPAVISLKENNKAFKDNPDVGRLVFGQIALDEQNHPAYVKYMATPEHTGRITIYSLGEKPVESWDPAWNPIQSTNKGKGGDVAIGTELTFECSVNPFPRQADGGPRYWVYYTTDGSEPDINSEMYNYNNNKHGEPGEEFTKPVIPEGSITIKTIVVGYGKKDSEVTTFKFTGVKDDDPIDPTQPTTPTSTITAPAAPTGIKASATGYQSIKVSWKKPSGSSGYQIDRSTKKTSGYQLVGTVGNGSVLSFTNTSSSVKTGTVYYYKIRAFKIDNKGSKVYGKYSAVVSSKTKLNKPAITSIKVKGKNITLKWKKTPGATGYQVYRSTKKSGKYTLIKTLKGNGKISVANKKLKKKKIYFYKIRAYRTVSGKKVYSSFSTVKYKKIK